MQYPPKICQIIKVLFYYCRDGWYSQWIKSTPLVLVSSWSCISHFHIPHSDLKPLRFLENTIVIIMMFQNIQLPVPLPFPQLLLSKSFPVIHSSPHSSLRSSALHPFRLPSTFHVLPAAAAAAVSHFNTANPAIASNTHSQDLVLIRVITDGFKWRMTVCGLGVCVGLVSALANLGVCVSNHRTSTIKS